MFPQKFEVVKVNPTIFEKSTPPSGQILTSFATIPINFMFALFCCPFRLTRFNKPQPNLHESTFFNVSTTYAQTIICIVVTVVDVLFMIKRMRAAYPSTADETKNPASFLTLIGLAISDLNKCVMIKTFWRNQEEILKIVNCLVAKVNKLPPLKNAGRLNWRHAVIIVTLLYTSVGFINFSSTKILPQETNNQFEQWAVSWWAGKVNDGRKIFFVDHFARNSANQTFPESSFVNVLVGVLTSVGILQRCFIIHIVVLNIILFNVSILFSF